MVFMVEPLSISAAVTRLPHSVDGEPYAPCVLSECRLLHRLVSFVSAHPTLGSPCALTEHADFAVGKSVNDTGDTKPSSRDTPTIQGIPTMTPAGALDADFVAKSVP